MPHLHSDFSANWYCLEFYCHRQFMKLEFYVELYYSWSAVVLLICITDLFYFFSHWMFRRNKWSFVSCNCICFLYVIRDSCRRITHDVCCLKLFDFKCATWTFWNSVRSYMTWLVRIIFRVIPTDVHSLCVQSGWQSLRHLFIPQIICPYFLR